MIRKLSLKLKSTWEQNEERALVEALRRKKLLRLEFLYSAVDGERSHELTTRGNYRKDEKIFAFTEEQLRTQVEGLRGAADTTLLEYLDNYQSPAIIIWGKEHFTPWLEPEDEDEKEYGYEFKNPVDKVSAIYAIIRVNLPRY